MRELALFAGAGGGILGGTLLGWRTVAAIEIENYPRAILLQRQADGILPRFPVWDDVRTFDGKPWRGRVDVISGGFPCQDISAAGRGAGITGERSGLWTEFSRIIGEVRPRFVFVENSPLLVSRGLDTVLSDLAEMGFNAEWGIVGAYHAGAPHKRDRIWVLAHAGCFGSERRGGECGGPEETRSRRRVTRSSQHADYVADTERDGLERRQSTGGTAPDMRRRSTIADRPQWWDIDPADLGNSESFRRDEEYIKNSVDRKELQGAIGRSSGAATRPGRPIEPVMGRVAHGVAHRVDRLKAIGNGQVPAVAVLAFMTLYERIKSGFKPRKEPK